MLNTAPSPAVNGNGASVFLVARYRNSTAKIQDGNAKRQYLVSVFYLLGNETLGIDQDRSGKQRGGGVHRWGKRPDDADPHTEEALGYFGL